MSDFRSKFVRGLLDDCGQQPSHNVDYLRFPGLKPTLRRPKTFLEGLLRSWSNRCGWFRPAPPSPTDWLEFVLDHLGPLEEFHDSLQDEYSKAVLVEVLRFRVLGNRHTKLRRNAPDYWVAVAAIDGHRRKRATVSGIPTLGSLDRFEVRGIVLDAHPLNLLNTFLIEQYAYRHGSSLVQAEPGEIVLDCGACFGDTSLYFADKVGPTGHVYALEPDPRNVEILEGNLASNPGLRSRITVVNKAVWNTDGQVLDLAAGGPGSRVSGVNGGTAVETVRIDAMRLPRVDLIKMDIEGSELPALVGAERSLRAFRPKLAISLYHRKTDFIDIPRFLSNLNLGYAFFLDHATIHAEETVLFARATAAAETTADRPAV